MKLEPGSKAPDFSLPTDGGGKLSLKSLLGKKVVLYFYPKDGTTGCTKEAIGFRDAMPEFEAADVTILGASKDSPNSHDKFKADCNLPFNLLSDTNGTLCVNYGTWVQKDMYGKKYYGIERSTFLIDEKGVIRRIWRKVKLAGHVADVLDTAKDI
jgi:thioredoxin-dependent peroxiredoxin